MVYPALLPLMRTTRLPAVDWTEAPRRFQWTRPFRRKTKSDFCAFANTFQTQCTFERSGRPTVRPTKFLIQQVPDVYPRNQSGWRMKLNIHSFLVSRLTKTSSVCRHAVIQGLNFNFSSFFSHSYRQSWYYQCFIYSPTDAPVSCLKKQY